VRLWRADTGRAVWRASALVRRPLRLRTHRGWERMEAGSTGAAVRPAAGWCRGLAPKVQRATETPDGRFGCVVTGDGHVERWQTKPVRRLYRKPLAGVVRQVLAVSGGCVVRTVDSARLFGPAGGVRELVAKPAGVAWSGGELLIVAGKRVHRFDGSGLAQGSFEVSLGVVTAARVGAGYALGFNDGNVELVDARGRAHRRTLSFEQVPSSPVARIMAGPSSSIILGFANGQVGLWSLKNGRLLDRLRVHGPVQHLVLEARKLYAVSELGDHRVMDLSVFYLDYCKLLRQVWRQVKVTWEDGRPVRTPAPTKHRCYQ